MITATMTIGTRPRMINSLESQLVSFENELDAGSAIRPSDRIAFSFASLRVRWQPHYKPFARSYRHVEPATGRWLQMDGIVTRHWPITSKSIIFSCHDAL